MCLTVLNPETIEPQVAEEDMEVYKIICQDVVDISGYKCYFTPFMLTRIHFDPDDGKALFAVTCMEGKYTEKTDLCNETKLEYYVKWFLDIKTHKPLTEREVIVCHDTTLEEALARNLHGTEQFVVHINKTLVVNQGIHAYCTREDAITSFEQIKGIYNTMMIAKAIIPKGSFYFIGTLGDIVSNQMVITNKFEAVNHKPKTTPYVPF